MRRSLAIVAVALALVAAGLLVALVPAGAAQSPPPTTEVTATETTTTETAPETTTETPTTETTVAETTTTAATTTSVAKPTPKPKPKPKPTPKPRPKPKPKPKPKPAPRPVLLPQGVTIGGVHVGGLSPAAALAVVRAAFRSPLVLTLGAHKVSVFPSRLAVAYAKTAVGRARSARPGTAVQLSVHANGAVVRRLVDSLAKKYRRDPVDSKLLLRDLRPYITPGEPGKTLDRKQALGVILAALRENRRTGVVLPYKDVPQQISRATFGPVIVIRRSANRLYLYNGMKPWRTFTVATGQAIYPTPLGRFEIVVKWKDPWWYPPNSPWAKGAKPIPPGPGNPLGTRWMGISSPGVGIHGTPDPASLGYSVSHGCIRMYIPNAEWLFDHVNIGTPVYILPA